MKRIIWPLISCVSLGVGGLLGSYHQRRIERPSCDDIVQSRWSIFTHAATAKKQLPTPGPPNRSGEIMKFGFPGYDEVRTHDNYVLSYDCRMRNPKWVFECLTREDVKYNDAITRTNCQFEIDQLVHPFFQSTNEDYRGSGYDRGHMAAAANHRRSDGVMQQTFLLSNVSPQIGEGFNRGIWNELEKYVRTLTKKYAKVYVCTGPLYLPYKEQQRTFVKYEVIGNSVAVPTHFFKIIVGETSTQLFDLRAFIIPNSAIPDETHLERFLVPVDVIERAAGILLFERLPKNALRSVNAPL
ncbi:endonuclease G, mitochondrial-like [Asterias amurensis]|uniref:endonuclease G, mitochondrial-like n=1 Tax=Asterias amurensis TaxID=7602 RepID=UPI003AB8F1C8